MKHCWTAGSLFSGAGGMCLGFERAGFRTLWAVENDPYAAATFRNNFTQTPLLERDVKTVEIRKDQLSEVDVLHAGFPCQSFSGAGARKGLDDPRGQLFFEITRIIREFGEKRPSVLLLENAPFLRYGEKGSWFLRIQREIQKAGYWFRDGNATEINTSDLTVLPQSRTRLYMAAFATNQFRNGRFLFPEPDQQKTNKPLDEYIDFEGCQEDSYYLSTENRYYHMIARQADQKRRLYHLRKYYVRPISENSCPTLTANMGMGGHNVPFLYDACGLRKMTERECARLQGFPDNFEFPEVITGAKRYMQIGNSVSLPVVESIAERLKRKIDEERNQ